MGSSIIDFLSGASTSANKANNYHTNAADQSGKYFQGAEQTSNNAYSDALSKLISSTGSGSPAAQTFANEQSAALQPQFQRQNDQLAVRNAAQGIGSSGSGLYNAEQLASDQSATLAGAIAPLYSSALGMYGGLLGSQAGAQSGIAQAGAGTQSNIVGQGAQAANNAYGQSIQDLYDAASAAAGGGYFGGKPSQSGTTAPNPYEPQSGGKQ